MKKISAVLLVLVLVGSVVFAGLTGSVETTFGVDLDGGDFGLKTDKALELTLVWHEGLGENKGGGDIYAEIAASFTFGFDEDDDPKTPLFDIDFDYAKIVSGDWFVSLLGAVEGPNFASATMHAYTADDSADPARWAKDDALDAIRNLPALDAGLEVGYQGYSISFAMPYGATNNFKNKTYEAFVSLLAPEVEVGDGLVLGVGAAAVIENDEDLELAASVKADYEMDELALSVAADTKLVGKVFDAEVAVAATYDFVNVDVYFATNAEVDETIFIKNLLSVKATATIDAFDVEVTGKDLVNAQDLGLSVDWAATDEISVNVNGGYGIVSKDYYGGAGVTYTVDEFKAALSGKYSDNVDVDKKALKVNASIESDALVDGANLYAKWESENLLDKGLGSITLGAKLAF